MSANPSRFHRFWKELKRRRVVHVITIYASSSFVLIELVNNLSEPFNLPEGLGKIVVIVLAVGLPLVAVLSWLYDLTGEGIERTRPIGEVPEELERKVPNAWKIATYVSFAVILGLVTFNILGKKNPLRTGDIQSLVILPFENYTGDDQMDNMVASMHSLLIGDMGRISGLRVIGKTSSKVYADTNKSAKEIARELNVDGVVEATVTCLGDSICMQFRLLNAKGEESQLWVGDYHEDKSQILNMYNQITQLIAKEVRIELTEGEKQMLARQRTFDRDAVDAYLKGFAYLDDLSEESMRKAEDLLSRAVQEEPEWAAPVAGLAFVYGAMVQMGYGSPGIAMEKQIEYMNRALELDPDLPELQFNIAAFAVWTEWDWEKGEREFRKALEINPSDAVTRIYYAHLLAILQRNDEALLQGRFAVELDPLNPLIHSLYAPVLACDGDWNGSMQQLDEALALDPNHFFALQLVDLVAFHLGDQDRAIGAFRKYLPFPETFFDSVDIVYHQEGFTQAYEKVIQELERTGFGVPMDMAWRYILIKQNDKALDWLEEGYETHDQNMPYMCTGLCAFDALYDNPRFTAIVEKMKLPMPARK